MNINNLNKVKEFILANPEKFDMRNFVMSPEQQEQFNRQDGINVSAKPFNCYCIGGMTALCFGVVIDKKSLQEKSLQEFARVTLDLTPLQAHTLFFKTRYSKFDSIWINRNPDISDSARAQLVAKRIEVFIESDGTI